MSVKKVPGRGASLTTLPRRAASSAGGQVAEARTEITIRYRPFISAQSRVLYRGAVYNIRHVNNLMARNETLILTCDTGVNDG